MGPLVFFRPWQWHDASLVYGCLHHWPHDIKQPFLSSKIEQTDYYLVYKPGGELCRFFSPVMWSYQFLLHRKKLLYEVFDTLWLGAIAQFFSRCILSALWLSDWLVTDLKSCDKRSCHRCRLFTPLQPGMWWCLVAAKYWLTAWGAGVREPLSLSSQVYLSKPQSKSTHFLCLILWKSQILSPPSSGLSLPGSASNTKQDLWVQTLLSAHFCDPRIIYITSLLATASAPWYSTSPKDVLACFHAGYAEHFILLTRG